MLRIVLDANIIISAGFGGVPLEAVRCAAKGVIYVNEEIEKELKGVVERLKDKLPPPFYEEAKKQVRMIIRSGKKARRGRPIRIYRDPKDNAYLELAKAAKIDVLVTGDKDLLSLSAEELKGEGLQRLKIMTPKDFIEDFSDILG